MAVSETSIGKTEMTGRDEGELRASGCLMERSVRSPSREWSIEVTGRRNEADPVPGAGGNLLHHRLHILHLLAAVA
ncbi:hypothetical protein CBI38_37405 (plasmid) [Rhodococcus oxybenzonivorans]|uniref:Uncharacterized protein n=1 Tax=Rhodococcus oxybenzonivorans TaxID=1990687 RepID=A0A2S2C867_9NOCA|nr:hypothetical protein CBI38_37405 [Rhodococcus oxybenzonivorans]